MKRRNFVQLAGAIGSLAAVSPILSLGKSGGNIPTASLLAIKKRIKAIGSEEYAARLAKARKLMADNKLDAIFMEGGSSMRYFTGISWGRSERLFAMILPVTGDPVFITPKFEEGRAIEQVKSNKLYTWQENESPYSILSAMFSELKMSITRIGVEETTRFLASENIRTQFPSITFSSADIVTAGCRSVKSENEIELMQIANDITKDVYMKAVSKLKIGMTEHEFAEEISLLFSEYGVEGGALVLFGAASAFPHGLKKTNTLKENDIVLIDGGCSVEGYESDITRTIVFGKPTEKMKTVFDVVLNAQTQALSAARPGIEAQMIDAAARNYINKNGFGPDYTYFTHRLGHGIGLDGHEWHYLTGGNKHILKPGNMFSNEPGIYIPGEFGIRIEDEMIITDSGARLLLPRAKSLTEMF